MSITIPAPKTAVASTSAKATRAPMSTYLATRATRATFRAADHADAYSDAVDGAESVSIDLVGKARAHQTASANGLLKLAAAPLPAGFDVEAAVAGVGAE